MRFKKLSSKITKLEHMLSVHLHDRVPAPEVIVHLPMRLNHYELFVYCTVCTVGLTVNAKHYDTILSEKEEKICQSCFYPTYSTRISAPSGAYLVHRIQPSKWHLYVPPSVSTIHSESYERLNTHNYQKAFNTSAGTVHTAAIVRLTTLDSISNPQKHLRSRDS